MDVSFFMTIAQSMRKSNIRRGFFPDTSALRIYFEAECARQKGRLFLWLPVFLASGAGVYFALPAEPPVTLGAFAFFLSLSLSALQQRGWEENIRGQLLRLCMVAFAVACAGFFLAQLRTVLVYTPMLEKELGPVEVAGVLKRTEDMEGGSFRLWLEKPQVEKLAAEDTPRIVRLSYRGEGEDLRPGQELRVLAHLNPPSPPVMPGAFDFRRYAFFQGIGAVGFIYEIREIRPGQDNFLKNMAGTWIERIRFAVNKTVTESRPEKESAVITALLTGARKAITEADQEAMRASGLAHILAISGLHVGLFSGLLFFAARLAMAAFPAFALRHPVKKYAALIAMGGAFFYMLLAGATIPARRAMLMSAIVFLAIIMDRSPISMRLVACAALLVLALAPESLISASFQMSFAAVTALIAFYDALRPALSSWYRQAGWGRRVALYFLGVSMTTVIATLATAPFALFHFQQVAVYGILANILAMPIMAFVIMPAAVFALLLMPLGLESLPLALMGMGVSWMLEIAHWVAGIEGAVLRTAALPLSALISCTFFALILILWNGSLRSVSFLFILLSFFIIINYKQYDIFFSSSGKLAAFSKGSRPLYASSRRAGRYTLENWERLNGFEEGTALKWPREQGHDDAVQCDEGGCRALIKGKKVSFLHHPYGRAAECRRADILISFEPLRKPDCAAPVVIDRFDALKNGAYAIRIDKGGRIEVRSVAETLGQRPWSPYRPKNP